MLMGADGFLLFGTASCLPSGQTTIGGVIAYNKWVSEIALEPYSKELNYFGEYVGKFSN